MTNTFWVAFQLIKHKFNPNPNSLIISVFDRLLLSVNLKAEGGEVSVASIAGYTLNPSRKST